MGYLSRFDAYYVCKTGEGGEFVRYMIVTGPDVPDVTPQTWKGQPVGPKDRLAATWGMLKYSAFSLK